MASAPAHTLDKARPGDLLLVIHDFAARSPDELTLVRGDRIELIERDDDFGDGWFLGKHLNNGTTGLFPEVYTTPAPKGVLTANQSRRVTAPVGSTNGQATNANSNGAAATHTNIKTRSSSAGAPVAAAAAVAEHGDISKLHQHPVTQPNTKPVEIPKPTGARVSDSSLASQMASPQAQSTAQQRSSIPTTTSHARSTPSSMDNITSPVMNETLSVIEEHITDMSTPRHSTAGRTQRTREPTSVYSTRTDDRASANINGEETEEEESGALSEAEVKAWSADRTAQHLQSIGVEKAHCDIFREQEITGEVLLELDQSTIFLKEFELGPVGRRLKTWHKIRQLQVEVSDFKPAGNKTRSEQSSTAPSADTRASERSISTAATRPSGAPSMTEAATPSHGRKSSYPLHSPDIDNQSSAGNTASMAANRPSAAALRSLNHSRRHSSIDSTSQPLPSKNGHTFLQNPSPTSPVPSHQAHGSFDRSWTMGPGHRPTVSTGSASGRPLSTIETQSANASEIDLNRPDNVTVVSSIDLDRGYFSGNEVENRNRRNVLRKPQNGQVSQPHSRQSSFTASLRQRSASGTHYRGGSAESIKPDAVSPTVSPAQKSYYFAKFRSSKRAASSPESSSAVTPNQDFPPTVTKLEYGNEHSIDAIATSPNVMGSETSSLDNHSPMTASSNKPFGKSRATGLRAISDAVIGGDRFTASPVAESPMKDSPLRTGSSTPSGTSKSFEIDEQSSIAKTTTNSTAGANTPIQPHPSTAARRKTKKDTSAYTRGLERRTPQEQMDGCDYSGWMKKKSSNVMATWKSRLFVLRGRRLSYYYTENDTEEKGLIDISNHRVLPANDEKIVGLHATLTGAATSPTSPHNATTPTAAATEAAAVAAAEKSPAHDASSGLFIFKLVPPREGLSKAVNFTKPTVHYFAVDNLQQGRLWMAALMKATIDRDEGARIVTTYNQKTISLSKARAMRQRPPALMSDAALPTPVSGGGNSGANGLGIGGIAEEDPQSPKSAWDDDESADEFGHRKKESVIGSIKENLSLTNKRRTTSQSGSDVRSVGSGEKPDLATRLDKVGLL